MPPKGISITKSIRHNHDSILKFTMYCIYTKPKNVCGYLYESAI